MTPNPPTLKNPTLVAALLPIGVLIGLLVLNVIFYGDGASGGPNQIALLAAAATATMVGWSLRIPFSSMLSGVNKSIASAMSAILILLVIGALIGTWMISGIVPAMIYYGLQILSPDLFLVACVVVCSIVSVATGSSWSTVGTIGVALLGIGQAMGISPGLAAGAIISGAYFGDKVSPLSDTTNLAAAMAGTELFTHIRYMLWTTVPSIVITLVIFLTIGFTSEVQPVLGQTDALLEAIDAKFNLTPILFIVPAIVLWLVISKVDAVIALFVGAVLGGLFAVAFQPDVVSTVAGLPDIVVVSNTVDTAGEVGDASDASDAATSHPPSYFSRAYVGVVNAMTQKTQVIPTDEVDALTDQLHAQQLAAARIQTDNPELSYDEYIDSKITLLQTFPQLQGKIAAAGLMEGKGMAGMLGTVWLIICAMCFGGVMEACGLLQRITDSLMQFAQSTGSLIATTVGSCLFVNVTASDQYLSIIVPGRMFRETFQDRGLAPENLSRTLEDAGTATSVLVPWNTCGAFQSGTLNVETMLYAPFCFFNWISPLMTLLVGFVGFRIAKLGEPKE